ncbi:hypothetical protein AX17_003499 [Amanita inopinata Kibby_2008]|nr:hypothetical protein AX17_003499 [Amanita inopinata Kibby_2008]
MEGDTDTLIALVASLLEYDEEPDQILDALVQSNGDPVAAADMLRSKKRQHLKRKSDTLEGWLDNSSSKSKHRHTTQEDTKYLDLMPSSNDTESLAVQPRNAVNLMSVLQPPPKSFKSVPRLPPLLLSSPALVAKHVPCTLHLSVLSPELACQLFYTMIDASREWKRNKWWLFDKVVESPHRTSFFARKTNGLNDDETWQEAARYWYNGRMTEAPARFPPEMEGACKIIEQIVNDEIGKRKLFPLEWGGSGKNSLWIANVAAANCYQGAKESVGYHSDQLTYLGPYPTIASLSLGTKRNFNLREVIPTEETNIRKARTFAIPLPHNSLTIMYPPCQEQFKHSVPPQSVIDLYHPTLPRPDFRSESIPRCKCGVPCILRPDMKNRSDGRTDRYWWTCYAGAQNEGKGCNHWRVMDVLAEGRGPFVRDMEPNLSK